ncbi:DUF547 domain-containing protein [Mucilaginibacter sp. UYCu711]|uniref:DUF547 domain-containing protein n=1 Tax=Mucilaginibacter sp. UYCu711 TaxID=3156339 RepID=UPI003D1D5E67
MRKLILFFLLTGFASSNVCATNRHVTSAKSIDYIKISQDFLYAAKTGDTTSGYIDTLSKANEGVLANELNTDHKRLAFWLNIYNGFTQVILKKDPDQYKTRNSFFSSRQIDIAGQQLSLDDIEHGILRHSKIKWSEGYLEKLFPSAFEKKFRVEKLDYRIHFALNCGAKSCPPIAFYEPASIDKQLTVAVKTYLKGECEYDVAKNVVDVPALMGWFRHDFGGKENMLKILKQNKIIPQDSKPTIHFKKYDWSLYLSNYKSENNG